MNGGRRKDYKDLAMKKKIIFCSIALLSLSVSLFVTYISFAAGSNQLVVQNSAFPTFNEWAKESDALPVFKDRVKNSCKTVLKENEFEQQIDLFFETMKSQFSKVSWVDGVQPSAEPSDSFQAYVEKLIVPDNAVVAIHGDLHGDIHALNRFIESFRRRGFLDEQNPFKIKADNFYILFLGDYVDRGWYGAEVIYTILRLKNENPDRVFMTRGNHEDMNLNSDYGFKDELMKKFSSSRLLKKVTALYNFLPLALYLGAGNDNLYNIIQCCHGGIEVGFNPKKLLEYPDKRAGAPITFLMQKDESTALNAMGLFSFSSYFKNNKKIDTSNGFMWTDFIVNPNKPFSLSPRDGYSGTLFQYGKKATHQLLQVWSGSTYKLRSIFRAHQHGDMEMCERILNIDTLGNVFDVGVGKLWIENEIHRSYPYLLDDIAVVTFSVAPDTEYAWPLHAFGELHVASEYKNWRLYVHQILRDQ